METFKKNYNLEFLLDPLQRGRLVKIHGLKQLNKMLHYWLPNNILFSIFLNGKFEEKINHP